MTIYVDPYYILRRLFFRVTNYDTALLQLMAAVYYNLRQVYYILRWYYISCYSLLHFTSGIAFYVVITFYGVTISLTGFSLCSK